MLQDSNNISQTIFEPIKKELAIVKSNVHDLSKGQDNHLSELLAHILGASGKGLRPAITLLASKLQSDDTESAILMATGIELLHIATLIHDDIVDNSAIRHGRETINNLWGANTAILLGDFLFATSATFVCDTKNIRAIQRFSETIMELSSGQLMEQSNTYTSVQNREMYNKRIHLKTASLFLTAAKSGALVSGAPEIVIQALGNYGQNVGMAFQIVDDILDIKGDPTETGKPVGNDLLQGVINLPSLLLLEKHPINNPIDKFFNTRDEKYVQETLAMIQESTIIDECYSLAIEYGLKAGAALELLQNTPSLNSLKTLTSYATQRRF